MAVRIWSGYDALVDVELMVEELVAKPSDGVGDGAGSPITVCECCCWIERLAQRDEGRLAAEPSAQTGGIVVVQPGERTRQERGVIRRQAVTLPAPTAMICEIYTMKADALFDVSGLSVMITGAASGIGLGYATVMAANGARVIMVDSDGEGLEGAVAQVRDEGGQVSSEVVDVTQPQTLRAAVEAVVDREGRLDVLFANAGISAGPGFLTGEGVRREAAALENLSLDVFDRALAVNLRGALATLQAAVPTMKKQGRGRIIVTTTVSLMRTETLVSTLYVASKAALGQLVRQAALELAAYGILVNGIAPGPTVTGIGGGRLRDAAARAPFEHTNPLQRIGTPEDLMGAALFLASPASAYITGTQIVIDGGGCLGTAAG